MMKKAILVVSFGTSYEETRKKTIDVIDNEIKAEFQEYDIYNAYTSKMILKVIKERDSLHVNNVTEAMEEMLENGIEEVIVQPTLILNGIEYDLMVDDVKAFENKFNKIKIGTPLLTTTKDSFDVIKAFEKKSPKIKEKEAIVFMGHGSEHYTNSIYAALDYMFKAEGHKDIYMATVEAYPELDDIIDVLKEKEYKKLILIPFMIVAGDHANNDMASDEEDSWKTVLTKEGFEVECIVEGLGENEFIRKIFIEHIKNII